jgi:acyl-CoA reductase-like NAD-dependent aldehyde dehydrogenase
VRNPFTRDVVGTVPKATLGEVARAFEIGQAYKARLSALRARQHPQQGRGPGARAQRRDRRLITAESGLCLKDSVYEAGRVADVLMFGASECLKDDAQIFSAATSRRTAAGAASIRSATRCWA